MEKRLGPRLNAAYNFASFLEMTQKMADTEGFEPSKDREALASLAGRWFQPLTHVST